VSDSIGHYFDLLRDYFYPDGLPGPRLEPTGSVEAVKYGVVSDPLALGVLPIYALTEEFRAEEVCALPVRPAVPTVRLEAMVYRTRPPTHPAVAELIDMLRSTLDIRSISPSP
jgi:DNA-binding transcriptional LysR family regulator